MKERPILFSAPMMRALLAGSKTQTRRALRVQPPDTTQSFHLYHHPDARPHHWAMDGGSLLDFAVPCPYGQIGDRLYVRETFDPIYPQDPNYSGGRPIGYDYRATYNHGDRLGDSLGFEKTSKPAVHMPRAASRILLEVTDVRIERLQDISEVDAKAEGAPGGHGSVPGYAYSGPQSNTSATSGPPSTAPTPGPPTCGLGRLIPLPTIYRR